MVFSFSFLFCRDQEQGVSRAVLLEGPGKVQRPTAGRSGWRTAKWKGEPWEGSMGRDRGVRRGGQAGQDRGGAPVGSTWLKRWQRVGARGLVGMAEEERI